MPRRLLGEILRQVAFLLAPETPSLTHQLALLRINLHLGICACWHRPSAPQVAASVGAIGLARRGTCRATCSGFAAGGSIGLLALLGPSTILAGFEVGLGIDAVLCSFFIHGDDARFPLWVSSWDTESDVGDNPGVVAGNSLPHRFY